MPTLRRNALVCTNSLVCINSLVYTLCPCIHVMPSYTHNDLQDPCSFPSCMILHIMHITCCTSGCACTSPAAVRQWRHTCIHQLQFLRAVCSRLVHTAPATLKLLDEATVYCIRCFDLVLSFKPNLSTNLQVVSRVSVHLNTKSLHETLVSNACR